MQYDVIIIGAGASGLVCAAACGQRGRRVLVLDHGPKAARKVRIAGGGRCNLTNRHVSASDYICSNPHFVKSALSRFTPDDMLALLGRYKLDVVDEGHGRLFCMQGADAIASMLETEAKQAGVGIQLNVNIEEIRLTTNEFVIQTDSGRFASASLVVATGGAAWPQVGASGFAYETAKQFGLKVTPIRPGLVPLTMSDQDATLCRSLSGIALPVRATVAGKTITDALLFTHHGISGPVGLDISMYWQRGDAVTIDFAPNHDVAELLSRETKRDVKNVLSFVMPKTLAAALCQRANVSGPTASLSKKHLTSLLETVHAFTLQPAGTEGLKKAETTIGGVDVAGISSKTMESNTVAGLYFTGEALDVAGRLGGFNLQWAWSSGYAAGQFA
ncbi:NAD(P)/FAD-dependent oxidoreductase [Desulfovibrio inopinatus]|uniref:NAD(P)/FAD-dependent oxidoreductase n=1 Tax=Desulfovibrio inopinatus TaxID=102109 RepID=UPI00040A03A5|nr:NAD(P)/FAD-dependent oxidoreductase [Desulfovibrio inopinatus]